MLGRNPEISDEVRRSFIDPDETTWHQISLRMIKPSGKQLDLVLLRPITQVEVGYDLVLHMPELGIIGPARVVSIDPCPTIQQGPGNVVTGTFAHEPDGDLIDVHVSELQTPIGCTQDHRFWSEDRQAFIAAGRLKNGELFRTRSDESARVESISRRERTERVYNLEVQGEHVYEVTALGILVHNDYPETIYRALNSEDAARLLAGERIIPKGVGGSITDQVQVYNTKYISASQTLDNAKKFVGDSRIVIEIDVKRLIESGGGLVSHRNILTHLKNNGRLHDLENARDALEVLITRGIDPKAIKRLFFVEP